MDALIDSLVQGWANFFYRGPHWKLSVLLLGATYITTSKYNHFENFIENFLH